MTDKSDGGVGHLNTILARGGGNLNDPIFKSSNVQGGGGDGEVDRRIKREVLGMNIFVLVPLLNAGSMYV